MNAVAGPKQIKRVSNTGKPLPAYVYQVLKFGGFEPFAPVTWNDGRIERDHRGTPIARRVSGGELQDQIWWRGPETGEICGQCTIGDGRVREVRLMLRRALVKGPGRVPVVRSLGFWHLDCFKLRMVKHGRNGHDVKQQAGTRSGAAMQDRPVDRVTLDIRNAVTRPRTDWEVFQAQVKRTIMAQYQARRPSRYSLDQFKV